MAEESETSQLHRQLFEDGVKVRREVLGSEYVDNALKNATPFTLPGQELITEWAWGNIWQRPGLDRKQRSLLGTEMKSLLTSSMSALGMVIAQKAWLEVALHTRGAINNGLTEIEIREVVLQATVYCGTPAGVEAMQVTEKVINEMIEKGEYTRPKP
ncbi:unnamed protein product [Clonostachys rosea]|uniref:Carboxymuconolactone decarboxylase-like domain-containing protein n=1 Tax=Bionectria ochroleuca TaxID=29856 RepID=A0ABY6U7I5_BIOOC|nr:unnamed protein product [Clonostachys rosea]